MSSLSPLKIGSRVDTHPDPLANKLVAPEPVLGEVIGERYRLLRLLGKGAMGRVFLAENTAIGVEVAIKLLEPALVARREFRRRFRQEAQALASVIHPNVARCIDLEVGDPTFMVMEYVPGETLSAILRREGRLSPLRAVSIGCRLAWGLDAAHTAGVVHRDLKPPNIIITSDAEQGESPKIIDFGLAKVVAMPEEGPLTRLGQIIGTPQYMSPEQIRGEPVDGRSDVYALGCVLYEMIAGVPPCGVGDDVQIMYNQLNTSPKPLGQLAADVRPELETVVARALEKAPDRRYVSVREMAVALARSVDRRRQRQTTAPTPLVPAPRRGLRVGVGVGLALALVLAGAAFMATRTSATTPPAVVQRELLVITSEPPGAVVEVDGVQLAEATPTALRGLSPDKHRVVLRAGGRAEVERTVEIEAGRGAHLHVVMTAAARKIRVRALPAGGMVFLDGALVAPSTPAVIEVLPDDFHELRIEKNGFEPFVMPLTPDDASPEIVATLEVEKRPRGLLTIETTEAAEIWVDGTETGFVTPTRIPLRLTPGHHQIELRESSGRRARTSIDIVQGEILHLTLELSAVKGRR